EEKQLLILGVLRFGAALDGRGDGLAAAYDVPLVAGEEVCPIFDDRPAGSSTESLGRKRRTSRRERRSIVQDSGLSEDERRTAKRVRAGIGESDRHRGQRLAELGGELTRQHLHFVNAVEPVARVERPRGAAPLREMARAIDDDVVAPVDLTL